MIQKTIDCRWVQGSFWKMTNVNGLDSAASCVLLLNVVGMKWVGTNPALVVGV